MPTATRVWVVADADDYGPHSFIANNAVFSREVNGLFFGLCQLREGSSLGDLNDPVTNEVPNLVVHSGFPAVYWNHDNEFHINKNGRQIADLTREECLQLNAV